MPGLLGLGPDRKFAFVIPDKVADLLLEFEESFPLFLVEGDRKTVQSVDRDSPLLADLELKVFSALNLGAQFGVFLAKSFKLLALGISHGVSSALVIAIIIV